MIFSIVIVVIILAITFFQAIHGLFGAFIMMVLTLLSATLALGIYEDVYLGFVRQYLLEYGEAVTLVGLFSIWLILLRVFFDQAIPGNMVLPMAVERAGGAVCGFITGLCTAGMIALGFQLLPFEQELLGFVRSEADQRKNLALNPDGFLVSTVGYLSNNSLSGRQRFLDRHPDYLFALHGARTIPKESGHRAPINALTISKSWKLPGGLKTRGTKNQLNTVKLFSGMEYRVFRVAVTEGADKDGVHRFSRYGWRLVGRDEKGRPGEYYALAMKRLGESREKGYYVEFGKTDEGDAEEFVAITPDVYQQIDVVFAYPTGFVPRFLEYKRTSQQEVTAAMLEGNEVPPEDLKAAAPPPPPVVPKPPAPKPPVGQAPKGAAPAPAKPPQSAPATQPTTGTVAKISSGGGGTGTRHPFVAVKSNDIPVPLLAAVYRAQRADASPPALRSGHIVVDLPRPGQVQPGELVTQFEVPDGKTVLQISCEPNRARSLLGRAMSFAKGSTAQYSVTDVNGNRYWALGEARIARGEQGGRMELQYRADPEVADNMPERALQPARSIDERDLLTPQSVVIYLFVVPADANITGFSTQGQTYPIAF